MKPKEHTLKSLRITDEMLENMKSANKKLESMNLTPIPFQEFRRMGYDFFSKLIIIENEKKLRELLLQK